MENVQKEILPQLRLVWDDSNEKWVLVLTRGCQSAVIVIKDNEAVISKQDDLYSKNGVFGKTVYGLTGFVRIA